MLSNWRGEKTYISCCKRLCLCVLLLFVSNHRASRTWRSRRFQARDTRTCSQLGWKKWTFLSLVIVCLAFYFRSVASFPWPRVRWPWRHAGQVLPLVSSTSLSARQILYHFCNGWVRKSKIFRPRHRVGNITLAYRIGTFDNRCPYACSCAWYQFFFLCVFWRNSELCNIVVFLVYGREH